MITKLVKTVLGTSSERKLRELRRKLPAIAALEPQMQALSDEALQAKTVEFRERLAEGATLDSLLVEVAATVREASKRVLGMRPFDVQLLGGMVLNDGRIAEMKTGEGKTLVAAMPVYLNALSGKGVHVVTVNDYLASRDAATIGRLYRFMGMSVGVIVHDMDDAARKEAYAADITYGTNNEFGFDYLRDNMKFSLEEMVQREFNYAIVDEVDSILIDEARTPLIISGPSDDSSELYRNVNEVVKVLVKDPETYEKDDKLKTVHLTEQGNEQIEEMLRKENILTSGSLYDYNNIPVVHHVQQSLRAHTLFTRDVDYIVRDGKVVIIDEFTGRMMEGRRFSEGLHQALEAKEYTDIQPENHTLASITYQNYFRLYPKLSGMTGTAATEADEFSEIYNLDVVEIPTNRPVIRDDQNDAVYRTADEKYAAIVELVKEVYARKQPVLIGTTSIEKSELLSDFLTKHKIKHNVLNARFHEKEAEIISQAGAPGAVTIATNMAGRGTDIKLGGNAEMRIKAETASIEDPAEKLLIEESISRAFEINQKIVLEAGGLCVIGTERHESRRIDNQLRGRSGRQGDPGASRFFLSLEDDLMRIFGSDRMGNMLQKLGLKEGEAIVHPWINKALEKAQAKVEARNFDTRKNLLKYDDVMNDQRKEIYAQRRDFMKSDNVSGVVREMLEEVVALLVDRRIPEKSFPEQWDLAGLESDVKRVLNLDLSLEEWRTEKGVTAELVIDSLVQFSQEAMQEKFAGQSEEIINFVEKSVLLQVLDEVWKEHLMALDYLRQGIGLRAYGQKDPLNEYKREAFDLFNAMLDELKTRIIYVLSHMNFEIPAEGAAALPVSEPPAAQTIFETFQPDPLEEPVTLVDSFDQQIAEISYAPIIVDPNDPSTWSETPRNALCPCGSGKKYKYCHGGLGNEE